MSLQRFIVWMLAVGTMLLGTGIASGQTASTGSGQATSTGSGQAYPNRPIRIVTSDVGGGNDFIARLIVSGLTAGFGQPVVIENRPSGIIPGSIVSKATPDGYTLLIYGGTFWLGPLLQSNVPYDVVKDFAPISLLTSSPNILVVTPSFPINSVKELIALAKAKPDVKEKFFNAANEVIGSAPEQLAATIKSEYARVGKVIKDAGIRAE